MHIYDVAANVRESAAENRSDQIAGPRNTVRAGKQKSRKRLAAEDMQRSSEARRQEAVAEGGNYLAEWRTGSQTCIVRKARREVIQADRRGNFV
jgi:hypothetical protein